MNIPSIGALNTGSDYHLLDHIAPLADLLDIPLIVSEELNFKLAKIYYPHVRLEYQEDIEFHLNTLGERFNALIECKYWKPHLKALFQNLHKQQINLIFCPHGQSDKGFASPLLAPYAQQDIVLLYGNLLIEMLKSLKIWSSIDRFAMIGDYRKIHYLKYQSFYDLLAEKEIFSSLPLKNPTLLYAPTWQDADGSTSFFEKAKKLTKAIPQDWNCIIKVHPLLEQRNPAFYYSILKAFDSHCNIRLVSEFPSIHPILERVDAYLGDFSSVGYDFLPYNRPMIFFPHPTLPPGKLHQCGLFWDLETPLSSLLEKSQAPSLNQRQKALYSHAFSSISPETLKRSIYSLVAQGRQNKYDF